MTTHSSLFRSLLLTMVLVPLGSAACSSGDDDDAEQDSSPSTGEAVSSSTASTPVTSTSGADSTGASDEPLPDGEACIDSEDCIGECYFAEGIGGTCGECGSDEDCPDGGCSPPGFLEASPPSCNDGSLSSPCETDAACQDPLTCVVALDLGQFAFRGCSSCTGPGDCGEEEQCNLELELGEVRGYLQCVPNSSVVLGGTCSNDAACASGFCVEVSLMTAVAGVCSECREDGDCDAGQTCNGASIDMATLTLLPGTCG